jgi:hypothetical protein
MYLSISPDSRLARGCPDRVAPLDLRTEGNPELRRFGENVVWATSKRDRTSNVVTGVDARPDRGPAGQPGVDIFGWMCKCD